MEDKTCKTCRWWTDRGSCMKFYNVLSRDTMVATHEIECEDCGGAMGGPSILRTGPDFGCIHHEPKAPATTPESE